MFEYAILHFSWEQCQSFHSPERCTHSLAEETLSEWGLCGWRMLSNPVQPELGLYCTLERFFELEDEDQAEDPPADPDGERGQGGRGYHPAAGGSLPCLRSIQSAPAVMRLKSRNVNPGSSPVKSPLRST